MFQRLTAIVAVALLATACQGGASSETTGTTSGTAGQSTTTTSGGSSTTGGVDHPATDGGCPYCMPGPYAGVCEMACPAGARPTGPSYGGSVDCVFPASGCSLQLADCGGGSFPCLVTDAKNCGACGHACGSGQICSQGACSETCGGSPARVETDPLNCGGCGNVCPKGQVCGAGVCANPCAPTPASCAGMPQYPLSDGGVSCPTCPGCTFGFIPGPTCVDVLSDSNNCGACGRICPVGQICSAGGCVQPCEDDQVCGGGGCQAACPAGLTACGGDAGATAICVDLRNDPNNCGGCGNSCASCVEGTCVGICQYYGPDAG